MSSDDKVIEIKNNSNINIAGVDITLFTDIDGNAWLTKQAIVDILCKEGDYSFRISFPEIFELKVMLSTDEKFTKEAKINGNNHKVFHESILYKGMFIAQNINGFNNQKVTAMIDSIFIEVLPSIRKHGQYPPPINSNKEVSKWGAIKEIATQMNHIAQLGEEHDKRIKELEWKTAVIDEERLRDQSEISQLKEGQSELQNQMNELLGTPDHRTVRLRMLELGISRSIVERHKMEVGQSCKKTCEDRQIPLPEKIPDGRFMVNTYPVEIIDTVIKKFGLLDSDSHQTNFLI